MAENQFKIKLEIADIYPINSTWFQKNMCRRGGKPAYLMGEEFEVLYKITNFGEGDFPGGWLNIIIVWENQRTLTTTYRVKSLKSGEDMLLNEGNPSRWGVQAPGFALFHATLLRDINPKKVQYNARTGDVREEWDYYTLYKDDRNPILSNITFFSIYAQTIEEFYQLWAMIGAIIAILYPVFSDVIASITSFILSMNQH